MAKTHFQLQCEAEDIQTQIDTLESNQSLFGRKKRHSKIAQLKTKLGYLQYQIREVPSETEIAAMQKALREEYFYSQSEVQMRQAKAAVTQEKGNSQVVAEARPTESSVPETSPPDGNNPSKKLPTQHPLEPEQQKVQHPQSTQSGSVDLDRLADTLNTPYVQPEPNQDDEDRNPGHEQEREHGR